MSDHHYSGSVTVHSWLSDAASALQRSLNLPISTARLESQVILSHVLGVERVWLFAHPEFEFSSLAADCMLERRLQWVPLAHLTSKREFYGREFYVNDRVLIPRQETETLVEAVLDRGRPDAVVVDVGTGSGCIAITLKLERPNWAILASDVSLAALQVAQINAERLGASVAFARFDTITALKPESVDLIVSNPPYIDWNAPLPKDVSNFDPKGALFAGENGLAFYRQYSEQAEQLLRPAGLLAVEIGFDQGEQVLNLFREIGRPELLQDLGGRDRVVVVQKL